MRPPRPSRQPGWTHWLLAAVVLIGLLSVAATLGGWAGVLPTLIIVPLVIPIGIGRRRAPITIAFVVLGLIGLTALLALGALG